MISGRTPSERKILDTVDDYLDKMDKEKPWKFGYSTGIGSNPKPITQEECEYCHRGRLIHDSKKKNVYAQIDVYSRTLLIFRNKKCEKRVPIDHCIVCKRELNCDRG